jgi:hypothetical protein
MKPGSILCRTGTHQCRESARMREATFHVGASGDHRIRECLPMNGEAGPQAKHEVRSAADPHDS